MIDKGTIDRIREATDIVALVGETVKLVRAGRSFKGLCPFHKEKTPSFHVNPETGRYYCFGCQASGDTFQFLQETEGLSFTEAARQLAERTGVTIVETQSEHGRDEQNEARRRQQELFDVSNAAASFFEQMLQQHPLGELAREELERRNLVPASATDSVADALQAFRVGYAPYGWDRLARHLARLGMSPRAAETAGLLAPRRTGVGHYDRFRHRLMFAVLDLQGRVVAFSGRSLPEPSTDLLSRHGIESTATGGEPAAKYINSPESPVFKKRETVFGLYQARQHVRRAEQCVLVEGNFDVLSLHARGLRNVVAPLGTAFTEEQAAQIRRFAPTVVFLFDGDRAGRAAVAKSRTACHAAGLLARVAHLPDGRDPDDLCREQGPEAIQMRIAAARGMLESLIDAALDYLPPSHDAEARLARVEEVAKLIAAEPDAAVRAMAGEYANEVVARLGIPGASTFRALCDRIRQDVRSEPAPRPTFSPQTERSNVREATPFDAIGREILGALLDYPELLSKAEVVAGLGHIQGDAAAAIAVVRRIWEGNNPAAREPTDRSDTRVTFQQHRFLEQTLAKLPASMHQFAAARLAAPRIQGLEEARTVLLENLDRLRVLELVQEQSEVVEQLQQATASGDQGHELDVMRRGQGAQKKQAAQYWSRRRDNASER